MPSAKLGHLLPLWDSDSSSVTAPEKPIEELQTQEKSMILISVPPVLEDALREVVRDDAVDSNLRKKIADRLPSVGDHEQTAAAVPVAAAAAAYPVDRKVAAESTAARVTLTPATLARALPHIRRVMNRRSGSQVEGGVGQNAGPVREGTLGLLRGGGLVFPESRAAAAAALKQGEERRRYEERRERLLLLREQKEYQRMTANIQKAPRETVRDIQASFKFQAGMGANMVMAVFATFVVSYWASKFIVGDNKSHRLVIGLVGAVFMLLVEMLVFVTRSLKADEVLEAARQDAEESHTAVGVHRSIPARGGGAMTPVGGRGMLDDSSRREGRGRGEYELVATREDGERKQEDGDRFGAAAGGISRVSG